MLLLNTRFGKFFSYYRPYRGLLAADIACAAAVAAIALVFPLLVQHVTGTLLAEGLADARGRILLVGLAMLALIAVSALCTFFFDARGHGMGAMMERDMRADLFSHMQRLPQSFFDGERTGQLMTRLTSDLESLSEVCHHAPEDFVVYLGKFVGALAILALQNARLTLVLCGFLPLVALYTAFFSRRLSRSYRRSLESIAQVNAQAEDSLQNIRVVQSFTGEAAESEKFRRANERFCDSRKDIYAHESYLYTGVEALTQLMTASVVVLGGLCITGGSLSLPGLITFILYTGYLVEPIPRLAQLSKMYQEAFAGFGRFMDILETEPAIRDRPGARDLAPVRGEIDFEDVSFTYREGQERVLQNVNLHVRAGEYVALVGASGVGKTTLCALIPRFYDVTAGCVRVDGVDVREATLASLRAAVGVVHQENYLFAGSVLENILYGRPGASREEAMEAARRAGAHEFIAALPGGYDTQIGERGVRLSGGQRQRLSIARAFLKDPPILILDEATSALDSHSERLVQQSLDALSKGRTTLVIAHRLSTIQGAERIVVLSENGVAEEGTHAELLARGGVYAELYNA